MTNDAEKAIANMGAAARKDQCPEEPSAGDKAQVTESLLEKFTSCRWVVGYMCCTARFCQSAVRQLIGMAVVCMTLRSGPQTPQPARPTGLAVGSVNFSMSASFINNTGTPQMVPEFAWSPEFEALILNSFNIGFFFTPIVGGQIATMVGGKRVIAMALLAGSVVTILVPVSTQLNEILVVVLRMLAGMFLGVVDPAIQALWAKWAPKYEKAQLTTCSYTGLSIAGILTFFISGHLCGISLENGWPFIFYFFGGFTLLCFFPWMLLVHDSPEKHPRILEKELRLINLGKTQSETKNKKMKTPWKAIFTSGPFWAIVVAHICYTWVMSWILAYLPKYLEVVMHFDIEDNGLYSSLPFVGRMVTGFLCSWLSDWLLKRNIFSTGTIRKIFQVVGCLGCAVCTLIVGFLDSRWRIAAVVLLVLAMSFQNCTSVAFRINHLDIAPRFAGVMMGITVTVAMAISLSGPPLTAAIVRENTREEWLIVFIIVAAFNIFGGVIFALFASGEVQTWALPPKTDGVDHSPIVTVDSSNPDATRAADRQASPKTDLPNGLVDSDGVPDLTKKPNVPAAGCLPQNETCFKTRNAKNASSGQTLPPVAVQEGHEKSSSSQSDTDLSDFEAEARFRPRTEPTKLQNDEEDESQRASVPPPTSSPEPATLASSSPPQTENLKNKEPPKTHLALRKRISSTDLNKYFTIKKGAE